MPSTHLDLDPRTEMDRALEKAIEVSRRQKRYSVSDGRLRDEQPGRYRYTFTLEAPWDLSDDTDLELESSALVQPLPAKLLSTKEEVVTITVGQRLPVQTLDHAYLVVDRARLLRKMQEALDQPGTPAQLGLKLFGALESTDGEAESPVVDSISAVFQPDEAQRCAILRALESELLMILGPPGTGKTDVLAAIALLHSILYKARVLITSHTNIAIDNAVIRLAGFFRRHDLSHLLEDHHLVRYGDPHLADLMSDNYRSIAMPLIIEDEIEPLHEEIARLERRREQLRMELARGRSELPKLRAAWQEREVALLQQQQAEQSALADLEAQEQARLTSIERHLLPLLEQNETAKQTMQSTGKVWNKDHHTYQSLQSDYQKKLTRYRAEEAKLKQLRTHAPIIRFFVQLARDEWENDLDARVRAESLSLTQLIQQMAPLKTHLDENYQTYQQAEQQHKDLVTTIASWKKRRATPPQQYAQKKSAWTQSLQQTEQELATGNPHIAVIEQEIESWAKQIVLLDEALARLDQQIIDTKHKAARVIVENASIVGATLTALYLNPLLLSQEWDVVIVDEGSMAPPPAVMIAADRARSHLVVVGDPLQLAPVCKLQDPDGQDLIKRWLGRDVFSHGGYTLQEAGAGIHHSILLPYQGRMHTDICDLVRHTVYKGLLKDRNPHAPRPQIGPEPEHAVVLYDTGPSRQARACKPASGSSRYNVYHAQVVKHLAEQVLPDMPNVAPECIGIVTPYAAQRDCIKELLKGTELEVFARVGTIHAFQGLEFDALILDLVESPGLKIAPFLCGGWGSDAMRLLNVAVTRARHKLLIVANMPYISQVPASFILPQILRLASQKKRIPVNQDWP